MTDLRLRTSPGPDAPACSSSERSTTERPTREKLLQTMPWVEDVSTPVLRLRGERVLWRAVFAWSHHLRPSTARWRTSAQYENHCRAPSDRQGRR
jgi:hypothetical protein